MQCRAHVAQLGRLHPQLRVASCEVLVLLGGSLQQARKYAQHLQLPFPVLADPGRDVYDLYGLARNYVFIQRTASLIVDREGVVRYLRLATNPQTWLKESGELLKAVQALDPGRV